MKYTIFSERYFNWNHSMEYLGISIFKFNMNKNKNMLRISNLSQE